jgi:hypothetical protein
MASLNRRDSSESALRFLEEATGGLTDVLRWCARSKLPLTGAQQIDTADLA